jgi:methylated-DNA-[protein]-cysteine S-methyltransferase
MPHIIIYNLVTEFGDLILASYDDKLCMCDWRWRRMRPAIDKRISQGLGAEFLDGINAEFREGESPVILRAAEQLNEYFDGIRSEFDLELLLVGTDFQKSVWRQLMTIPYGKTDTYIGLAQKLGKEKALRAVAAANGANAISIIIPCHRIIGSDRDMVGYAGGVSVKKKLLSLESAIEDKQTSLF